MRFKIFFNDSKNELDINCLKDDHIDTILPESPDQHVYYPIPNDLLEEIKECIMPILDKDIIDRYNSITDEIQKMHVEKRKMINDIRTQLNPVIIEKCEKFRFDNAEWFI